MTSAIDAGALDRGQQRVSRRGHVFVQRLSNAVSRCSPVGDWAHFLDRRDLAVALWYGTAEEHVALRGLWATARAGALSAGVPNVAGDKGGVCSIQGAPRPRSACSRQSGRFRCG